MLNILFLLWKSYRLMKIRVQPMFPYIQWWFTIISKLSWWINFIHIINYVNKHYTQSSFSFLTALQKNTFQVIIKLNNDKNQTPPRITWSLRIKSPFTKHDTFRWTTLVFINLALYSYRNHWKFTQKTLKITVRYYWFT